jgi:3-oxoadipate enol-lactonase
LSFVNLDGVDLYYEVHGEGPAVVFIHGVSGTHLIWWQQIAELRHHFTCLIYDQRGFCRSRLRKPYNVADGHILYSDLCGLIEHVGLGKEKLSLVSASLGTGPALHYAMEHQEQIDKLALLCGVGGIQTPLTVAGSQEQSAKMKARREELKKRDLMVGSRRVPPVRSPGEFERFAVAYHPYGPIGEALHLDLGFLYAELMANTGAPPTIELRPCLQARPVSPKEASTVKFPLLMVGGTEDALYPPAQLEETASVFPQAKLEFFKGAGHAAYFERARRFNDLLVDFLHG